MIKMQDPSIYTDLNGLNAIKRQADSDPDAALKQVSKQFESMFIQMMMKSMRDANKVFEEGGLNDTNEVQFYRDMYDQQLALSLSSGQGIGIAEAMYRQLKGNYGDELGLDPEQNIRSKDGQEFNGIDISSLLRNRDFAIPERSDSVATSVRDISARGNSSQDISSRGISSGDNGDNSIDESFENPEDFVRKMTAVFKPFADQLGVDTNYLISQAALETGWGNQISRHRDGSSSFNLFNIKANNGWNGDTVKVSTLEYIGGIPSRQTAQFRSYDSFEESLNDFVQFLESNGRYQGALEAKDDPKEFVSRLQQAGYATDPHYAEKIIDIARRVGQVAE